MCDGTNKKGGQVLHDNTLFDLEWNAFICKMNQINARIDIQKTAKIKEVESDIDW